MVAGLVSILTARWDPSPAGLAALAAAFLACEVLPFVRTPLVVASGLVFGTVAAPIVSLSTTAGGVLAFLLGRYLFRSQARRWLGGHRLSGATLRAFDLEGWRVLALLRFYGPVPSVVQNYVFAISRIPMWSYTLVTFVCSLPQIAFYVYLGSIGHMVLRGENPGPASLIGAACAVCSAATCVTLVGRRVRLLLQGPAEDVMRPA